MANPHLKREAFYTRLISVAPYKRRYFFFFQNFHPAPFEFEGIQYEYLPFNLVNLSSNLELDGSSGELQVPNLDIIRDTLLKHIRDEDNSTDPDERQFLLLGGRVKIDTYFPEDTAAPIISYTYLINSLDFNDQYITFALKSPLTSFNGLIPSMKFDQSKYRELPLNASNQYTSNVRPF